MTKSLLLKDEPNIVSLSNAMFTNGELSLRRECPREWENECFSERSNKMLNLQIANVCCV